MRRRRRRERPRWLPPSARSKDKAVASLFTCPGPPPKRLLHLPPTHLPNHRGPGFRVGIVEIDEGVEEMRDVVDLELFAIPAEHLLQRKAMAAQSEEIDEIFARAALADRRELHAGEVLKRGEAAAGFRPENQGAQEPIAKLKEAHPDPL